jgi:hypothetical protein
MQRNELQNLHTLDVLCERVQVLVLQEVGNRELKDVAVVRQTAMVAE